MNAVSQLEENHPWMDAIVVRDGPPRQWFVRCKACGKMKEIFKPIVKETPDHCPHCGA